MRAKCAKGIAFVLLVAFAGVLLCVAYDAESSGFESDLIRRIDLNQTDTENANSTYASSTPEPKGEVVVRRSSGISVISWVVQIIFLVGLVTLVLLCCCCCCREDGCCGRKIALIKTSDSPPVEPEVRFVAPQQNPSVVVVPVAGGSYPPPPAGAAGQPVYYAHPHQAVPQPTAPPVARNQV